MRRLAFGIHGLFLVVAVLLAGMGLLVHTSASAQGAGDEAMAGHPAVGAWSLATSDGEVSVLAFTSDGILLDTEQDGSGGAGSWNAADETTAAFTLVILGSEEDMPLSITVRGTFTVDAATDTASLEYSLTVLGGDGTLYFSGEGTGTATRIPVEGPELAGSPVAGFPVMSATPAP